MTLGTRTYYVGTGNNSDNNSSDILICLPIDAEPSLLSESDFATTVIRARTSVFFSFGRRFLHGKLRKTQIHKGGDISINIPNNGLESYFFATFE